MKLRWLLPLLLVVPVAAVAQVANSSFGMPSRITIEPGGLENVAAGDADGDGRADVAVTDQITGGMHRLRLYFQNVDRSLSAPTIIPIALLDGTPNYDAKSVAMVDLNNDGAKEIVVGGYAGIYIVRLSAARIPTMAFYQGPAASCRVIATGDLDGDGKMDIACHAKDEWPEIAVVYYGDGQGGIRNILGFPTGAAGSSVGLSVGDVTGDGRADIVVTASHRPDFFVLRNNGSGGFLPPLAYAHPASASGSYPVSVVVTDMDGDGVNEVVIANAEEAPEGRLNIYRLGGSGTLVLSRQVPIYSSTTALLVGDVGGDGDKDLILGHWSYGQVTVMGDADPGMETQRRYELPGFGNDLLVQTRTGLTNGLALADLNSDGCNDLVSATFSGLTILYGCRPYASTVPVSDFDADGVSDLYWWAPSLSGLRMLWPWASKQLYYACPLPCPSYAGQVPFVDQAVGDFDGDGSSDVFFRNPQTGENVIVARALYDYDAGAVSDPDWNVVGAGDFDGDDRSDLLWRNGKTGQTIIWPAGLYDAGFWEQTVSDMGWKVAAIGDFDGDGRSDLFWRHATTGQNYMWLQGRSALAYEVVTVGDTRWRLFGAGDFDGDGRDDLVWRNTTSGAGILWLGAQPTSQVQLYTVSSQDWQIAAIGDYNGDGRADLMWRNEVSGANIIWRNAYFLDQQQVETVEPSYKLVK